MPEYTPESEEMLVAAMVQSPSVRIRLEEEWSQSARFSIYWLHDHYDSPQEAVTEIADLHPALLLLDLDERPTWFSTVLSDPATRRLPLIALATQPEAEQLAIAAHAEAIINPLIFDGAFADIFSKYGHVYSPATLTGCDEPLSEEVLKGLYEFNNGEYFECHESLETAWRAESGPVRDLYKAVLQIAVAYLQITRGNYQGAHKMFVRATQWFLPLPDQCQGIDVAQLRRDALTVRTHLEMLGPARLAEFDLTLLQPVHFEETLS